MEIIIIGLLFSTAAAPMAAHDADRIAAESEMLEMLKQESEGAPDNISDSLKFD